MSEILLFCIYPTYMLGHVRSYNTSCMTATSNIKGKSFKEGKGPILSGGRRVIFDSGRTISAESVLLRFVWEI